MSATVPQQLSFSLSAEMVARANLWGINLTPDVFKNFITKIDGLDEKVPVFEHARCHLWTAAHRTGPTVKGNCHGTFNCGDGELITAHRFSYILAYGIPSDAVHRNDPCPCGEKNKDGTPKRYQSCCRAQILHMCTTITGEDHNGQCVNPLHMKLGFALENQEHIRRDGTGRGGVFRGETAYQSTLTDEKAALIWNAICETKTQSKKNRKSFDVLALQFGCTVNVLKDMSRGKTWNHITGLDKSIHNKKRIDRDQKKTLQKIAAKRAKVINPL